MDCSLPGSSVHGIFQAIVLEWIAISFSRRGSSQPRDRTRVSHIVDRCFTIWATREVLENTLIVSIVPLLKPCVDTGDNLIKNNQRTELETMELG